MSHVQVYNIGDILVCLHGVDSYGLLRRGKKYKVADTDGIRVQLEGVSLTWLVTRFRLSSKAKIA